MKLRKSPSGPFVTVNGIPIDIGSGAQLRLVDGSGTVGGSTVIPTAPAILGSAVIGVPLTAALPLPNPGYKYGAHVSCDVANPSTNTPGAVQLYLDASIDGGSTWTEIAQNSHTVYPSLSIPGNSRNIRLDLPLLPAVQFAVTATPATPSLTFRARIGASSGGGVVTLESLNGSGTGLQIGTVYLAATENA